MSNTQPINKSILAAKINKVGREIWYIAEVSGYLTLPLWILWNDPIHKLFPALNRINILDTFKVLFLIEVIIFFMIRKIEKVVQPVIFLPAEPVENTQDLTNP